MEGVRVLLVFLFVSFAAVRGSAPKQYDVINLRLNWTAALAYCKERHTDLASIRSQEDHDLFVQLWTASLSPKLYDWIWLGATDLNSLKGYFWMTDGVTMNGFDNWLPGEPDNMDGIERCLTYGVSTSGNTYGFNDLYCALEQPFACEYYAY